MTMHTTPWAMQNLSHNAEVVRQASQSLLAGTGVVAPGDLAVTANGTPNMSVNVAAGSAWVPGTQGSTAGEAANYGYQSAYGGSANFTSQGSYYAYNDASVNLTIAAANATNPRIDLVVVNAQDAIYSGSNNQIQLQVITGTAAATPTPPAIPANCVVLAQVAVGAAVTSINSGNITDARPFATTKGADLYTGTENTINGPTPPAGTRKLTRTGTYVGTTDSNASFVIPMSAGGGNFPNALVGATVVSGDNESVIAGLWHSYCTPSGLAVIIRNYGGSGVSTGTLHRVDFTAYGW